MMNRWSMMFLENAEIEVVAVFGGSRIVRLRNGRLEIRGGDAEPSRKQSRSWNRLGSQIPTGTSGDPTPNSALHRTWSRNLLSR